MAGYNVGINLVETDGRAAPSIQGAATSVAGFIVRSLRGPYKAVRQITSFAQFTAQYGSFTADATSAYAIKGFFDNGGGVAYVTRAAVLGKRGDTSAVEVAKALSAFTTFKSGEATPKDVLTVAAGVRGREEPGPAGNDLGVKVTTTGTGTDETFTLGVYRKKADGTFESQPIEEISGLRIGGTGSRNPERVNDNVAGSRYIVLEVLTGAAANPATTTTPVTLAGGRNEDLKNATVAAAVVQEITDRIDDFTAYDIQLLASTETSAAAFVTEALKTCQARGDCMFVGHVPDGLDVQNVGTSYSNAFRANKQYGALYFPFILVNDPLGSQRKIPPTGHVLGVYARTDRERGVWKAPAGNEALIRGALDVAAVIDDVEHTKLVTENSVNAIRPIPGQGIVIDSSRTLSINTLWLYVGTRLFFNYIKTSLKYGLRFAVQEPNDEVLWNKVKFNTVTPFLLSLWRRRAFGPGAPDEVFEVKIDGDNNPPDNIQKGLLNIEVYLYPSRPAETIVIQVGQQEGLSKATEAKA